MAATTARAASASSSTPCTSLAQSIIHPGASLGSSGANSVETARFFSSS
jgi:hypothetical protein